MAPDSLKSESMGRLLPEEVRCSTARDNCESAITGMLNSFANAFKFRDIVEISCSLFPIPLPLLPPAVISWR